MNLNKGDSSALRISTAKTRFLRYSYKHMCVSTRITFSARNSLHNPNCCGECRHLTIRNASSKNLDTKTSKILIIGGTGRVGSSSAANLLRVNPEHEITLAGRTPSRHADVVKKWPILSNTNYKKIDAADRISIEKAAAKYDLVIHTAGPFQRNSECPVLEGCIAAGTPYLDVCDDMEHSVLTKSYSTQAQEQGVPCITTAGIYPGISNVMAGHMCSMARKEYDDDLNYCAPAPGGIEPQRLLYSYYTAGTGGVGPTILETTFLLAGEPVTVFKDGKKYILPPVSERRTVDFGAGLGKRGCWLYNLPEVRTGFEVLKIPSVSARFGTSPAIWNWGTWLLARLAPKGQLEDPQSVRTIANVLGPVVRAADGVVGEAVGMRVELQLADGKEAVGLFIHKYLSQSVGSSVSAFADAMLTGCTDPVDRMLEEVTHAGVWYPEERQALNSGRARVKVMESAAAGYDTPCFRFELNKTLWQLESDPKYFAMGMYF